MFSMGAVVVLSCVSLFPIFFGRPMREFWTAWEQRPILRFDVDVELYGVNVPEIDGGKA